MHYHIMASTGPQDLADLVAGDSVTVTFDYTSPYTGTVEAVGMAKFGGLVAEDGPVLVTAIVSKHWYGHRLLQTVSDDSGFGYTSAMPTTYVVEYLDAAVV